MRLFLAISLQPELARRLQDMQKALESSAWSLKPSPAEKLHLTLHFLGETPENLLEDLHHDLKACAQRHRPFDLKVGGLGAFPSWEDPRVLWAGVQDPKGKLAGLFDASRRALNAYRLFKLREEFQPHISLAKVGELKASWDPRPLQGILQQWEKIGILPVEEFSLIKSAPGEGAPYDLIEKFSLG